MIDFLRARWPDIRRLLLFIVAISLAFLLGQRSVQGHFSTPIVHADDEFRAFEVPDPVLPEGCCVANDTPESPRYVAGPATPAPSVGKEQRRTTSRDPGPSTTRTVGGTVRDSRDFKRNLKGVATWHATGKDGPYAAAGPLLRAAMGPGWRGDQVLVCHAKRCLIVTLSDWCQCDHDRRLVDLSDEAFQYLSPLSRGVIRVSVGW